MNKKVLYTLLVLVAAALIIEGVYTYSQKSSRYNEGYQDVTSSSSLFASSTKPEVAFAPADYKNGEFQGVITSMSKSKSGSISVSVDVIQMYFGKEAFLALAEDYSNGKVEAGNWDILKSKYPTFADLAQAVHSMTDKEFDDFYYSYQAKAQREDVSLGIFGGFPNGMVYTRNENQAIRTFPLAANVKNVSITNGPELTDIRDMYAVCVDAKQQQQSYADGRDGYVGGHFVNFPCSSEMRFVTKEGKIIKMEVFYRP